MISAYIENLNEVNCKKNYNNNNNNMTNMVFIKKPKLYSPYWYFLCCKLYDIEVHYINTLCFL